jgi:hypothetical protein
VWLGFWAVEVDPSPKFQLQDVGEPVDVSVNCTACPTVGNAGLKVNEAVMVVVTAIVWLALLDPELLVTVRVTV